MNEVRIIPIHTTKTSDLSESGLCVICSTMSLYIYYPSTSLHPSLSTLSLQLHSVLTTFNRTTVESTPPYSDPLLQPRTRCSSLPAQRSQSRASRKRWHCPIRSLQRPHCPRSQGYEGHSISFLPTMLMLTARIPSLKTKPASPPSAPHPLASI